LWWEKDEREDYRRGRTGDAGAELLPQYAGTLHYMRYNFCRIHQTLRVTRAMEARISDHVCSLDEVIALLD
jgi:hypothetical protein